MVDLERIANESKASQGAKELYWLLRIVAAINPKVIVEIGVHQGYSMQTWQEAFEPEILVGIDNDLHDLKWNEAPIMDADSHDPKTGAELVELLQGKQVDFLFLDGDHMYEGVKKDFEMYAPLVRKGGIIAFDDMHLFDNPSVEVHRLWEEVRERWQSEWVHYDSNGVGVIHV